MCEHLGSRPHGPLRRDLWQPRHSYGSGSDYMNPISPPSPLSKNRSHDRRYFYKYVTAECASQIIRTRSLRWSSPILFNRSNDPFDTSPELPLDFDAARLNALLNEEWASLIEQGLAGSVGHPVLALLGTVLDNAGTDERRRLAKTRELTTPTMT